MASEITNMTDTSTVKLVTWDIDGTLYDADRFKRLLILAWLRRLLKVDTWRAIRAILKSQAMVARVHQNGGLFSDLFDKKLRSTAREYEAKWFKSVLEKTGPREGVLECMAYFKKLGIPQAVVSDYKQDYKLDVLGVSSFIDSAFSGETLGALKPSSLIFEKVCEETGVEPHQILHIGDRRDTDGMAANEMGCHYYHVEKGQPVKLLTLKDYIRGLTPS